MYSENRDPCDDDDITKKRSPVSGKSKCLGCSMPASTPWTSHRILLIRCSGRVRVSRLPLCGSVAFYPRVKEPVHGQSCRFMDICGVRPIHGSNTATNGMDTHGRPILRNPTRQKQEILSLVRYILLSSLGRRRSQCVFQAITW